MSSIREKFIPKLQKLSILLLSTMVIVACGGGSSGGGGSSSNNGLVDLSDELTLDVNVLAAPRTDGGVDVSVNLLSNGDRDTATRDLTITLQTTGGGVIGSLEAASQTDSRTLSISNGSQTFPVYPGAVAGTGILTVSVFDSSGNLSVSSPQSYTISAVSVTSPTAAGTLQLTLRMVAVSDGLALGTSDRPLALADAGVLESIVSIDGVAQPGEIVTFSTDLGLLDPATDLTDGTGLATVGISAGDQPGAGTVTASTEVGTDTATIELEFQTLGDDADNTPPSTYGMTVQTCQFGAQPPGTPCTAYGESGNALDEGVGNSTVVATITHTSDPVNDILVTFSLDGSVGSLGTTTTALTDTNGVATITLGPGTSTGAGTVVATAEPVGGSTVTASANFETLGNGAEAPADYVFSIQESSGVEVLCDDTFAASAGACSVIGDSGNALDFDATSEGYVWATLLDSNSDPVPGAVVTFTLESEVGAILLGSTVTDGAGLAEGIVGVGSTTGAGTVTASVSPTVNITLTDSVNFESRGNGEDEPPKYEMTIEVCDSDIDTTNGTNAEACSDVGALAGTVGTPLTPTVGGDSFVIVTIEDQEAVPSVPQVGVLVSYALSNEFGVLETITGLTDDAGQASVVLNAGLNPGTGLVTASANVGPDNTAVSSSEAFLTGGGGQPVPYEISIAVCDTDIAGGATTTACGAGNVYGSTADVLKEVATNGAGITIGSGNVIVHVTDFPDTSSNVQDAIVTFELLTAVGTLSRVSAVTDANGLAEVVLNVGEVGGAGVVSASVNVDGNSPLSVDQAFVSAGDGVGDLPDFNIAVEVCNTAVDTSDNSGAQTCPAAAGTLAVPLTPTVGGDGFVWATVLDKDGNEQSDVLVNFSLENEFGVLETITGLTDIDGQVSVVLNAGVDAGTGTVTANATVGVQALAVTDSVGFVTGGGGQPVPYEISIAVCDTDIAGGATTTACGAGNVYGSTADVLKEVATNGAGITIGSGNVIVHVTDFPDTSSNVQDAIVTFELLTAVGTLSRVSAVTDANGLAEVVLNVGEVGGAGVVSASVNVDGNSPLSVDQAFVSAGDGVGDLPDFNIAVEVCNTAVDTSDNSGAQTCPAAAGTLAAPLTPTVGGDGFVWATVLDKDGNEQSDVLVNFSLENEFGVLETITGLTDIDGQVSVVLNAGVDAGTGTVTANATVGVQALAVTDSVGFVTGGGGQPVPYEISIAVCDTDIAGGATTTACGAGNVYGSTADVLKEVATNGAGITIGSGNVIVHVTDFPDTSSNVQDAIVTFELLTAVGTLSRVSAVTDANGLAEVVLNVGEVGGAGVVSASVNVDGNSPLSVDQAFVSAGDGVGDLPDFNIAVEVCNTAVDTSDNSGAQTCPAAAGTLAVPLTPTVGGDGFVWATVLDKDGNEQSDVLVNFSLENEFGVLETITGLTDIDGQVSVVLNAGVDAGTGTVTANATVGVQALAVTDSVGFVTGGGGQPVPYEISIAVCDTDIAGGATTTACGAGNVYGSTADVLKEVATNGAGITIGSGNVIVHVTDFPDTSSNVQDAIVTFELLTAVGTLSRVSAVTDANGLAEVVLNVGEVGGAGVVSASVNVDGNSPLSVDQAFVSAGDGVGDLPDFNIAVEVCNTAVDTSDNSGAQTCPAAAGTLAAPLTPTVGGDGFVWATVLDKDGNEQSDVLVNFSLENEFGVLETITGLTDIDGQVSVVLNAGVDAGTGTVTANATVGVQALAVTDSVGFVTGGGGQPVPYEISIAVCDTDIAGGATTTACGAGNVYGSTADVLKEVATNGAGITIGSGNVIVHVTDFPDTSSNVQDAIVTFELLTAVGTLSRVSAVTDANGLAEVVLNVGEVGGAGVVSASVNVDGNSPLSVDQAFVSAGDGVGDLPDFNIAVEVCNTAVDTSDNSGAQTCPAAAGTLAAPLTPTVGGDGFVWATVLDKDGNEQSDVLVNFSLENEFGVLETITGLTDIDGQVSVVLNAGVDAGTGTVTANATVGVQALAVTDSVGFVTGGGGQPVPYEISIAVCDTDIAGGATTTACGAGNVYGSTADVLKEVATNGAGITIGSGNVIVHVTDFPDTSSNVQDAIVTFELLTAVGTLSRVSAVTDANGLAEVVLNVGEVGGAGVVSASVNVDGNSPLSVDQAFVSAGDGVGDLPDFNIAVEVCNTAVDTSDNSGAQTCPAAAGTLAVPLTPTVGGDGFVWATVLDKDGNEQSDVLVNFSLENEFGVLETITGLTDIDGQVSVVLNAGVDAGTGTVTANATVGVQALAVTDSVGFVTGGGGQPVPYEISIAVCDTDIAGGATTTACGAGNVYGSTADVLKEVATNGAGITIGSGNVIVHVTDFPDTSSNVQDAIVTFELLTAVGTLSRVSAVTDANGLAEVVLNVGEVGGAGVVSASVNVDGNSPLSVDQAFVSAGDGVGDLPDFNIAVEVCNTAVDTSDNSGAQTCPAAAGTLAAPLTPTVGGDGFVWATVLDKDGNEQSDVLVNFSLENEFGVLETITGLTDIDGQVSVVLNAGVDAGTGTVTANATVGVQALAVTDSVGFVTGGGGQPVPYEISIAVCDTDIAGGATTTACGAGNVYGSTADVLKEVATNGAGITIGSGNVIVHVTDFPDTSSNVQDAIVTFELLTAVGTLSRVSAVTDANGLAEVVLNVGEVGGAGVVSASVNVDGNSPLSVDQAFVSAGDGVGDLPDFNIAVEVCNTAVDTSDNSGAQTCPAAAGTLAVPLTPTVGGDGFVWATVLDKDGNEQSDVLVNFSLENEFGVLETITGLTDIDGQVSVVLNAGVDAGTGTVTANATVGVQALAVTDSVGFVTGGGGQPVPYEISIAVCDTDIAGGATTTACGAGNVYGSTADVLKEVATNGAGITIGSGNVIVHVTDFPDTSSNVQDAIVTFELLTAVGTLSRVSAVTDANGLAEVVLNVGEVGGAGVVSASVNVDGNSPLSVDQAFVSAGDGVGDLPDFNIAVEVCNTAVDTSDNSGAQTCPAAAGTLAAPLTPTVGGDGFVWATVLDKDGNEQSDVLVNFSLENEFGVLETITGLTDIDGQVSVVLNAGVDAGTGTVTANATVGVQALAVTDSVGFVTGGGGQPVPYEISIAVCDTDIAGGATTTACGAGNVYGSTADVLKEVATNGAGITIGSGNVIVHVTDFPDTSSNVQDAIVTFELLTAVGTLSRVSAVTDANGLAEVVLNVGEVGGAGVVSASVNVDGNSPLSVDQAFVSAGDGVGDLPDFNIAVEVCNTAVDTSDNSGAQTCPAAAGTLAAPLTPTVGGDGFVWATVLDKDGNEQSDVLVNFSLENEFGVLETITGLTDIDGQVSVVLNAGVDAGTGTVTANATVGVQALAVTDSVGFVTGGGGQPVPYEISIAVCDTDIAGGATTTACGAGNVYGSTADVLKEVATNGAGITIGSGNVIVHVTDFPDTSSNVQDAIVTFELLTAVGTLSRVSAVTDANGLAEVVLNVGEVGGAGVVSASVNVDGNSPLSVDQAFVSAGDGVGDLPDFNIAVEVCNTAVDTSDNSGAQTCPAAAGTLAVPLTPTVGGDGFVWATVLDKDGNEQSDVLVNFSLENEFGVLETITGLTDIDGQVSVVLNAGVDAGTGTVTANATVGVQALAVTDSVGFVTGGGGQPVPYEISIAVCDTDIAGGATTTACGAGNVYGSTADVLKEVATNGAGITIGSGNVIVHVTDFPDTSSNVQDAIVTFELLTAVGTLSRVSAVTDANGLAEVVLNVGEVGGAGVVSASVNVDGNSPLSVDQAFVSAGDGVGDLPDFNIAVEVCNTAVDTSDNSGAQTCPAAAGTLAAPLTPTVGGDGFVWATVLDKDGNEQSDVLVNFSLENEFGVLETITGLTDIDGQVSVVLNAGVDAGTGTVTANATVGVQALAVTDSVGFVTGGGGQPVPYEISIAVCDTDIAGGATTTACGAGNVYGSTADVLKEVATNGAGITIGSGNVIVHVTDFPDTSSNVQDAIVTFELLTAVGTLSRVSAVTDANGLAEVVLNVGEVGGAGVVSASVNVDGNSPLSVDQAFVSAGDGVGDLPDFNISVQVCDAGTDCATLPGDLYGIVGDEIADGAPADVFVTLTDNTGNNLNQNVLVTFSLLDEVGRLSQTTALTDASGEATIQLLTGGNPGNGTVTVSASPGGNAVTDSQDFVTLGDGEAFPFKLTFDNTLLCNASGHTTPVLPALPTCTGTQIGQSGTPISNAASGFAHAIVTDENNNPVSGELVTFDLANAVGSLGTTSAITNNDGVAIVTLNAGDVGGAGTITASASPGNEGLALSQSVSYESAGDGEVAADFTISVQVCDAGTDCATLPGDLYGIVGDEIADGAPADVFVTLTDNTGNNLNQNVLVTFSLLDEVGRLSQTTALTDASGEATIQLLTGGNPGNGTVTVSASPGGNAVTDSQDFVTLGDGEAFPFKLTFDNTLLCNASGHTTPVLPALPTCTGTQIGQSGTPISNAAPGFAHAIVTDENNNPVSGELVTFDLANAVGSLGTTSAITNNDGVAIVTLNAGDVGGAGTITASASPGNEGLALSQSVSYESAGDGEVAADFTISVQVCDAGTDCATLPGDLYGIVGDEIADGAPADVFVTLTDNTGNNLNQNVLVTFSLLDEVGRLSQTTALTDASGEATIQLLTGGNPGNGTVTVSASPGGNAVTDSQDFVTLGDGEAFPFKLVFDNTLLCNASGHTVLAPPAIPTCTGTQIGQSGTPISNTAPGFAHAIVLDETDNPVVGELVSFSLANAVGSLGTVSAITNAQGVAIVTLNAGDVGGAGTITASASPGDEGLSLSQSVSYESAGDGEVAADFVLSVQVCDPGTDCASLPGDLYGIVGEEITNAVPADVFVSLTDNTGTGQNQNVLITLSVDNGFGRLSQTSVLTDNAGEATVQLSATEIAGIGTVTVTANPGGTGDISDSRSFVTNGGGFSVPFIMTAEICKGGVDANLGGCNDAPAVGGAIYGDGNDPLNDSDGNGFVTALVTTDDGVTPEPDVVVNFSLAGDAGVLIASSAVTDVNGIATVQIAPGAVAGAGVLTITSNPDGSSPLSHTINVSSLGDGPAVPTAFDLSLSILDSYPGGSAHGGAGSPITTGAPGFVVANVTLNGTNQPDELVTFSISNDNGILLQDTALTDATGNAVVQLDPGIATGAGTITAEVVLGGSPFTDTVNFASSVTPATADTISLGVDWTQANICDENGNAGYTATAIYVEDKGNAAEAVTTACQVGGSNAYNALPVTRELQTGVTATVRVHVYNETAGALFSDPVQVEFSSLCAELGKATLGSAAATTSTVTSVGGVATTTYLADGCVGEDTITATATVGTDNLAAQVTFNIETPAVSSIEFVSATPQVLALQGTGGANRVENSVVQFRVVGTDGNPSANRNVVLELSNAPGGVVLDTNLATSNEDGIVEVTVSSGTVPGTLKVRAIFDVLGNGTTGANSTDDVIVTSDELSVSSGLADADGINIFATIQNPEAWNYPNESVEITASLNDRSGGVVAIGTAVYFRSEMGRIGDGEGDAVCLTDATGSCSVTWYSNGPEETLYQHYDDAVGGGLGRAGFGPGFDRKGRNVIYAFTQGEETFVDFNGDNVYNDDGSATFPATEAFTDLGEVILDYNENGTRQTGDGVAAYLEPYVEYDGDNTFDGPDGLYNGVTCSSVAGNALENGHCADLVNISDSMTMAVSTSSANIYLSVNQAELDYTNYMDAGTANIGRPDFTSAPTPSDFTSLTRSQDYPPTQTTSVVYGLVTDLNGNAMPEGTVISAAASSNYTILGNSEFTIGSSSLPTGFAFNVELDPDREKDGIITITATTPKGNETSNTVAFNRSVAAGCQFHSIELATTGQAVVEGNGGGTQSVFVDVQVDQASFDPDCGDPIAGTGNWANDIVLNYFVTGHVVGDHVVANPAPITGSAGTITLTPASGYRTTVQLDVTQDALIEQTESMTLFLGQPDNDASLGGNTSYVLTINDDD